MSDDESGIPSESKFNLCLETLQKASADLTDIKKISINYNPDLSPRTTLAKAQHCKYRMIKQLFVRVYPLIKEKYREELKNLLYEMQLGWVPSGGNPGSPINLHNSKPVTERCVEYYYPDTDDKLDNFIPAP